MFNPINTFCSPCFGDPKFMVSKSSRPTYTHVWVYTHKWLGDLYPTNMLNPPRTYKFPQMWLGDLYPTKEFPSNSSVV
ncbi:hypothetical protein HanPI659440_Chr02g0087681 [Helianthus annuus]|nr:hypothetical protein HanPI659440_Chr02g0087681 [Helianthus annuus]